MTHDEMIEAVARAIADVTDFDGDRMASRYADSELRDLARAAIRVIAPAVLEEAAGWADNFADMNAGSGQTDIHAACLTARDISSAIRALKTRYEQ